MFFLTVLCENREMVESKSRLPATGSYTIQLTDKGQLLREITAPGVTGYILGRSDPRSSYKPDIDLAEHNALEMGVSRRHTALVNHKDAIYVIDLDSVNGTFLNDERLQPHKPYPLCEGDDLRLGSLNIHLIKVK
jgi:hypothetical protein